MPRTFLLRTTSRAGTGTGALARGRPLSLALASASATLNDFTHTRPASASHGVQPEDSEMQLEGTGTGTASASGTGSDWHRRRAALAASDSGRAAVRKPCQWSILLHHVTVTVPLLCYQCVIPRKPLLLTEASTCCKHPPLSTRTAKELTVSHECPQSQPSACFRRSRQARARPAPSPRQV